jgi:hypothetical protein
MNPIFQPVQFSGGAPIVTVGTGQAQAPMGFYKPYFWTRTWPGFREDSKPKDDACT